ncbi:Hypothetical protein SMAX5B_022375 [Scophthalmus maximus]|uniref:Uncharacterized protein n=1 Tax=Scophthalmus maximus TaxID=52904 RepID=A0A2U9C5Y7_SCOMX|nr:Hypothetical protein SMAX5B_022375 [Scophthalmus maximus]
MQTTATFSRTRVAHFVNAGRRECARRLAAGCPLPTPPLVAVSSQPPAAPRWLLAGSSSADSPDAVRRDDSSPSASLPPSTQRRRQRRELTAQGRETRGVRRRWSWSRPSCRAGPVGALRSKWERKRRAALLGNNKMSAEESWRNRAGLSVSVKPEKSVRSAELQARERRDAAELNAPHRSAAARGAAAALQIYTTQIYTPQL